jgi:methanogenic corrinoid protein MtbC1
MSQWLNQAEVEQATGLSREVLRKWELRFNFPLPERDGRGRRMYSGDDVERLRALRQLFTAGLRPRNIVGLGKSELSELLKSHQPQKVQATDAMALAMAELLEQLNAVDACNTVREFLAQRLQRSGLNHFVMHEIRWFNEAVGNAWASGNLGVESEHLYTATLQALLLDQLHTLPRPSSATRVLLTTPPGELHGLGLLCLQLILAMHGVECVNLGLQTPVTNVVSAVEKWDVMVVALSASVHFSTDKLRRYVEQLRATLPQTCQVWVGGEGAHILHKHPMEGVRIIQSLDAAVETWQAVPAGSAGTPR